MAKPESRTSRQDGKSRGVYLIAGGRDFDSFLAEEALERILAEEVGGAREDSVQVLRGDETSWARVLDSARTRSLFADRRAVVVRNADALRGDAEGLAAYLEDPTPGVALVLMAPKVDKRKGAWSALAKSAQVIAAEPLRGQALKAYVRDALRRRKLALTEDGLQELIDRVGQDLRRLMGEIDKLLAFGFGERAVGAEQVSEVLGRGVARPLYLLSDAFAAADSARVFPLLEEALDDGEPALKVLATLHRSLRQVRATRALQAARVSRDAMLDRLGLRGVMSFKLNGLLDAARAWKEADLSRAVAALDRADRGIKNSLDTRVALSAAVAEALAGVRPSRSAR
jgi:DNA polymerase-3 subunit delta